MEDEAVAPHDDSDSIVAVSKAISRNEKAFRLWEYPDRDEGYEIDEVAEIGEEVVHSFVAVGDHADRHEVEAMKVSNFVGWSWRMVDLQLGSKPVVEVLGDSAYEVAANKDVEDGGNERQFLFGRDGDSVAPFLVQVVNGFLDPTAVPGQLLF